MQKNLYIWHTWPSLFCRFKKPNDGNGVPDIRRGFLVTWKWWIKQSHCPVNFACTRCFLNGCESERTVCLCVSSVHYQLCSIHRWKYLLGLNKSALGTTSGEEPLVRFWMPQITLFWCPPQQCANKQKYAWLKLGKFLVQAWRQSGGLEEEELLSWVRWRPSIWVWII